jgi:hypothetical protein
MAAVKGRGQVRRVPAVDRVDGLAPRLALVQGGFYALSGSWPLVHLRSFERVTGPKTDDWLVKTVGVLVTVIGVALGLAGWRRRVTPEVAVVAAGSAAGLAAIDLVYVGRRRISPVYLLDALAEALLVALWAIAWRTGRPGR